ncbi:MAG: hypothetical protein OEW47_07515 [Thermoleophilia bacterium]|nr:hypothetical protein [Thermoleophilia bacterium]
MKALLPVAAALLFTAGCGGGGQEAALPLGRDIAAKATLEPTVHLFAEPVVARVEVVVDRDRLDPNRIGVETKFLPYDVERASESREDRGRFAVLRYEYRLRCLRIACIPAVLEGAAGDDESGRGERRAFRLPSARVLYGAPGSDARVVQRATWPELVSVSRIKESDVPDVGYVFKTTVVPLPEPDYRLSPTVLGAALLAGAFVLLALPTALVAGWFRRRRPAEVPEEEVRELTPLEWALELVEWASERENGTERRQALEVLAVGLAEIEQTALAESARALAWQAAPPSPEGVTELVAEVRRDRVSP